MNSNPETTDQTTSAPAVACSAWLGITNPRQVKWLIWSHEHQAWWCANSRGYTHSRAHAGEYDLDEACDILYHANYKLQFGPHEAIVPVMPND